MVHDVVENAVEGSGPVADSVEPVCFKYVADYAREYGVKTLTVMDHCAEMKGRVAEAEESGKLEDGSKVCASLVRDDSAASDTPLETYLPVEAEEKERAAFCSVFSDEVDACKGEVTTTSTLAPTTTTIPFAPPAPRSEWDSLQEFGEGVSADPPPPLALLTLHRRHLSSSSGLALLEVSTMR